MKSFKNILITIILMFFFGINIANAQIPPPPPGHETSSNHSGPTDVPVGSGLIILLSLASTYGGFKFYKKNRKLHTE